MNRTKQTQDASGTILRPRDITGMLGDCLGVIWVWDGA